MRVRLRDVLEAAEVSVAFMLGVAVVILMALGVVQAILELAGG